MINTFLSKPLNKFLLWLLTGLIICIMGITSVKADTYSYNQFTAQLYDNYAPTLSAVTTDQTNGRWQGVIPTMTANSAGAAWGISSNMVLLANHTYTLTVEITGTYGGKLVLSTYNRIGVGTTLSNAKSSYQNNSYVTENYSRVLDNGYTIQFAFTPTTNGSYIVFPFATNYTGSNQYFYLSTYTLDDLGSSGGVSQSDINNSLSSQTNTLNQSITNSQNAIINNNNQNAQDIQDTINDNFQTCPEPITFTTATGKEFDNDGNLVTNSNSTYSTNYIELDSTKKITLKNFGSSRVGTVIAYDSNKNYIDWWSVWDRTIDSPALQNAKYFKISYTVNGEVYLGTGECTNKIDETNNNLSNIISNLTDDSSATFDSSMINLIPNAPITNLLTIPISLLQSILTRANDTCSPISIPFLFNHNINFPCFTLSDYLGSVANTIDLCICFVMIYNIFMLFVSVFEDITTLRDGFLGLYEPQHAVGSYKPKHGKG